MLTSDEKAKIWDHVAVNRGNVLQVTAMTLYNAMDELEDQARTQQDQLTEKDKQIDELRKALTIVRDTLSWKKQDDRTSHGLWKTAVDALQGGES